MNFDKLVDQNAYNNRYPIHLKTISITSLPVEEIPCIEIWDINGLQYSSHIDRHPDTNCTFSSDYGDGYFKVSQSILGDFSIICRFGGELATQKDKTTLIFKYQNSTGKIILDILHFSPLSS